MTYPSSQDRFDSEKELWEALMKLDPGGKIELSFESKNGALRKRHLIYGWLRRNGLKEHFRIYWPNDTTLRVLKIETRHTMSQIKEGFSDKLQRIFEEMIKAETEPLTIPLKYREEGLINAQEVGELVCEYQEFNK